jgi:hypothetical protein
VIGRAAGFGSARDTAFAVQSFKLPSRDPIPEISAI